MKSRWGASWVYVAGYRPPGASGASELIICFNIKSSGCDLVGRHGGKWAPERINKSVSCCFHRTRNEEMYAWSGNKLPVQRQHTTGGVEPVDAPAIHEHGVQCYMAFRWALCECDSCENQKQWCSIVKKQTYQKSDDLVGRILRKILDKRNIKQDTISLWLRLPELLGSSGQGRDLLYRVRKIKKKFSHKSTVNIFKNMSTKFWRPIRSI